MPDSMEQLTNEGRKVGILTDNLIDKTIEVTPSSTKREIDAVMAAASNVERAANALDQKIAQYLSVDPNMQNPETRNRAHVMMADKLGVYTALETATQAYRRTEMMIDVMGSLQANPEEYGYTPSDILEGETPEEMDLENAPDWFTTGEQPGDSKLRDAMEKKAYHTIKQVQMRLDAFRRLIQSFEGMVHSDTDSYALKEHLTYARDGIIMVMHEIVANIDYLDEQTINNARSRIPFTQGNRALRDLGEWKNLYDEAQDALNALYRVNDDIAMEWRRWDEQEEEPYSRQPHWFTTGKQPGDDNLRNAAFDPANLSPDEYHDARLVATIQKVQELADEFDQVSDMSYNILYGGGSVEDSSIEYLLDELNDIDRRLKYEDTIVRSMHTGGRIPDDVYQEFDNCISVTEGEIGTLQNSLRARLDIQRTPPSWFTTDKQPGDENLRDAMLGHAVTAGYQDVKDKAERMYQRGAVVPEDITPTRIEAKVIGDHGTYHVMLDFGSQWTSGRFKNWSCTCLWGYWAKLMRRFHLKDRPCSHAMATSMFFEEKRMDLPAGEGLMGEQSLILPESEKALAKPPKIKKYNPVQTQVVPATPIPPPPAPSNGGQLKLIEAAQNWQINHDPMSIITAQYAEPLYKDIFEVYKDE